MGIFSVVVWEYLCFMRMLCLDKKIYFSIVVMFIEQFRMIECTWSNWNQRSCVVKTSVYVPNLNRLLLNSTKFERFHHQPRQISSTGCDFPAKSPSVFLTQRGGLAQVSFPPPTLPPPAEREPSHIWQYKLISGTDIPPRHTHTQTGSPLGPTFTGLCRQYNHVCNPSTCDWRGMHLCVCVSVFSMCLS